MADPAHVRIGEYESVDLGPEKLTDRDVDRLRALQSRGALTLAETRSGWRLTADATVGVLVLDRVHLTVTPKFAVPGDRIVHWLCYAFALPVPHRSTLRRWTTGRDGYAELVAAALLIACRELTREGLRRDYVRDRRLEPVLRGRLDVTAQVTRRFGMLDRLHVETFERKTDIWENRVLGTALATAAAVSGSPEPARALRDAATAFPEAPSRAAALRLLDRAVYNRLNARYRTAHAWARLALEGGGPNDLLAARGPTAESMLLAMPDLWERVVRRLTAEAAASLGGRIAAATGSLGITTRGDTSPHKPFRPDVLADLPGRGGDSRTLLPVDAKYKRYDRRAVGSADIHQLLTYIGGYASNPASTAAIVHPDPSGHTRRVLRVDGPHGRLGTIDVIGIDTRASPGEAVDHLRAVWAPLVPAPAR
ncbi:PE-PGRS family protein [Streptomyces sp. TRM43335]|uniref:PE-PGRS family protein n=1 Tax=Streptomyces taklimakanensis TaxID=2569853 RepID=A0A6G2BH93_9ACTN|nr:PE-PGRS family protein [Streptomyces taklimakanensis]MTE21645.1 PE-PGRS family protein [Streptomyces taklimakanensis]